MAEPMTMDEKIKRINELYHKSQAEGLSAEEKDEQARLRKEYINSVKVNLRSQLNNINIQNEDGSITNIGIKMSNHQRGMRSRIRPACSYYFNFAKIGRAHV